MIQNYINHIVFTIDASDSMRSLTNQVVKVFDNQVKYLAELSQDLKQETRVSVYLFGYDVSCLIYDMDVLRLPSLRDHYRTDGMTALIDGTVKSIEDLKLIPELYCDHAFLVYVLTDGQENHSDKKPSYLSKLISGLGDNWTIGVMVPNKHSIEQAKQFGFPENNIEVWSVGKEGVDKVGDRMQETTGNFMRGRSQGIRGTKSLFKVDASNLTKSVIKKNLTELSSKNYEVIPVRKDASIRDYVESYLGSYTIGSGYYKLTKKETIQANKHICIREKTTGKVYSGDAARDLLGLPAYEIKVAPETYGDWDIYIQSNSVNRKLIKGTDLIVLK